MFFFKFDYFYNKILFNKQKSSSVYFYILKSLISNQLALIGN